MSDSSEKIYKEIAKRIKKRYGRRKEIFSHIAAYMIFMAFVWGIWLGIENFGDGLFGIIAGFITFGWTIGIFMDTIKWIFDGYEDRALERELERVGLYDQKLKNDALFMRLSDDGELIDFEEELPADNEPRQAEKD